MKLVLPCTIVLSDAGTYSKRLRFRFVVNYPEDTTGQRAATGKLPGISLLYVRSSSIDHRIQQQYSFISASQANK